MYFIRNFRVLDVWEVNRTLLHSLGMDVMVGGIQAPGGGSRGGEKCRLECCVSDKIFHSSSAYQLHITTNKVSIRIQFSINIYI